MERFAQAFRYLKLAVHTLDPRRPREKRRVATASHTQEELLGRVEAYNQAAERQWQAIANEPPGRSYVLGKPLSTVRDTGENFYRLGLALEALDLGVGHVVLDFGAGTCWLSAILNRLGCRTISVDVSPTALQLGAEAFKLDARQRLDLDPAFVPYDGHRIPLPSESVDRIVCFDAFHHVPNQREILGEILRVLRRGGRAVLAEPGEKHSHCDRTAFDAARYGVLENDLIPAELFALARSVGFDDILVKPYPAPTAVTLSGEDHLRLIGGDHSVFPMPRVEDSLRQFHVVSLLKGEPRVDSRNPRTLRGSITPRGEASAVGKAGGLATIPVRIQNLGDTFWLADTELGAGYVRIAGNLLDEQQQLLADSFMRCPLPRDLAPGETVDADLSFQLPEQLGRFKLVIDLVDEKVAWFAQCGSRTTMVDLIVEDWPDSRAPHRPAAHIELLTPLPATTVRSGAQLPLHVRLTNTGVTRWLHGPMGMRGAVFLGVQIRSREGEMLSQDHHRIPLNGPVAPGEQVDLEAAFPAPAQSGLFRLVIDLVAEQICWFEQCGSSPLSINVQTTAPSPGS